LSALQFQLTKRMLPLASLVRGNDVRLAAVRGFTTGRSLM